MLLYVENKAYPLRTFVVLCQPNDTVARVRAQLLHSLYEIGHSNHQFRLRYKGTYMRDSYTLEEYSILNNAVIGMVPLNDISEWNKDMRFYQRENTKGNVPPDVEDLVQVALKSEIKFLERREKILGSFKIVLLTQILLAFLSIFTVFWYFFFAYALVLLLAFNYCPTFTRIGGWVGKNSVRRKEFTIVCGVITLLMMVSGIVLFSLIVVDLRSSAYPTTRCANEFTNCMRSAQDSFAQAVCFSYQAQCYETSIWTAIYFGLEILVMLVMSVFCWILYQNFKFEVGDKIESYLMQTKEIDQVLEASRYGNTSEKRNAAFELATMAASGDDNKFLIVSEGGLDVLITLALSDDATTQEYATEAIAECLAVPAIQDQFVAIGGIRTLTALLNTKNHRTLREAITAISYVVQDSDENKSSVVTDQGLDDMLFACKRANALGRKSLAEIYFELTDYDSTRVILASRTATTQGLYHLLRRSSDDETVRMVLETLEILAIEAPSVITNNESLLMILLELPERNFDSKMQLVAAKLLVYYAENMETCEVLASNTNVLDSLLRFTRSAGPQMLKTVTTISLKMTEVWRYRAQLTESGLAELLTYIQNTSMDRDTWNMAEQAHLNLRNLHDEEDDVKPSGIATGSMTSLSSSQHQSHQVTMLRERQHTNSTDVDMPSTSGM